MHSQIEKNKYLLSIIVPVYNEELVIKEFIRRIGLVIQKLNCSTEIIFVNDGSEDATLDILKEEKTTNEEIRIVNLSRNFGHQVAITAGMDCARGDAVVVIDADLQDPPELILAMVEKWKEGYEVIHAKRKRRLGETIFKTWTAIFFYRIMKGISNVDIPPDVGDFRLLSKKALNSLIQLREKHRYIRGLVAWLGYKHTSIEYDRDKRFAGKTKYPLCKMIKFSAVGISSFSILPLRLATFLGFASAGLSFLTIGFAFYMKYILNHPVSAWVAAIIVILFLSGVQLICVGILGEYIGFIHEESKKRPLYIVADEL